MIRLRNTIITFIVIVAGFLLLQRLKILPSLTEMFATKPVVIDQTPVLIKDIKAIGQLITYSFFDEVVADSIIVTGSASFVNALNRLAPVPVLPSADKQLVLIGRGKVLAGTNLSLLTDTSIVVKQDTVILFLPKPQIIDAILNPGDFETFIEKGDWTSQEVTKVRLQARRKMENHALQQNILAKAGTKSKAIMESFLKNLGYKNVIVY